MSKSYLFTLDKYYSDEEIENISPIIENYVNLFADENGVAKLALKDDVTIVIKRDEGLALHMVLDNPDNFTALPKKLTKAKEFLQVFITKMAEAIDKQRKANASVADAKTKVETEAEDSLLGYIGGGNAPADAPAETPADTTTVKVNGEEITDPAEKQKVVDEINKKQKELTERATKIFAETFNKVIKSFKDSGIDWLGDYLG